MGVLPLAHYGGSCVEAQCSLRLFGFFFDSFSFLIEFLIVFCAWKLLEKEFEVTKSDCHHVYLCMFIYLYVPRVAQVYYFVCIYSF
jgi:hypothetical protein